MKKLDHRKCPGILLVLGRRVVLLSLFVYSGVNLGGNYTFLTDGGENCALQKNIYNCYI